MHAQVGVPDNDDGGEDDSNGDGDVDDVHTEEELPDGQLLALLDGLPGPHHHHLPLHPVLQGGCAGVGEERQGREDSTSAPDDLETVRVHNSKEPASLLLAARLPSGLDEPGKLLLLLHKLRLLLPLLSVVHQPQHKAGPFLL